MTLASSKCARNCCKQPLRQRSQKKLDQASDCVRSPEVRPEALLSARRAQANSSWSAMALGCSIVEQKIPSTSYPSLAQFRL